MQVYKIQNYSEFKEAYGAFLKKLKEKLKKNYQIVDAKKLESSINEKTCLCFVSEASFVVAIQYFDFYELTIFYSDKNLFIEELAFIKSYVKQNRSDITKLKVSLCDNKAFSESEIYDLLMDNGFEISKKIARFENKPCKESDAEYFLSMVPEEFRKAEFAVEDDAKEILDCMFLEFDPIGDAIPELNEIKENIKKKQVVVLKDYSKQNTNGKSGKIISFTYFNIINSIYYGLFDYSDKEYRKYFVFFAIQYFMHAKKAEFTIKRSYGWRDMKNKRTTKFANKKNDVADGVIVCNMFCAL